MGNCRTLMQIPTDDQLKLISTETGFAREQIIRLNTRFISLDKEGRGHLDRDDFFSINELQENPLGDRIIDAFFAENANGKLTFREFCHVLAHFRPVLNGRCTAINSRESKLRFAFAMYDLDKSGYITRTEFKVILNMMVGSNISAEQLDDITDRTIYEGDYEKNGKLSFEEFCRAMGSMDVEQIMSINFL